MRKTTHSRRWNHCDRDPPHIVPSSEIIALFIVNWNDGGDDTVETQRLSALSLSPAATYH